MVKVHYEIIEQEPNESDPEGWGYILCGREDVEELTKYKDEITCNNCLKRINQQKEVE